MTNVLTPDAATKKHKIVVVDDHALVREGMVAILNCQPDFEVVGDLNDANEALKVMNDLQPNVLLTDIGMPSSPFEMVKSCLRENPELKVIFITAFNTETNLERALSSGAKGFISKGTQSRELVNAIRQVIRGEEYFSEEIKERVDTLRSPTGSNSDRHRLLSPREFEVLRCVAQGLSAKAIAQELHISVKTVDRHKSNIMAKLNIHNQVDLTRYAIREGWITP